MRIAAGLILGSVGFILPLFSAPPVHETFLTTAKAFLNQNLWLTISTLLAVMLLEAEVRALNLGERIATKLSLSETQISLAFFPALLGLLPAAAGARFSVGAVQALAKNTNTSPDTLAAVNFWFRHVNIFCNPLITGTVLAGAISRLPAHRLLIYGIPLTLLTTVVGWYFFIRPIELCPARSNPSSKHAPKTHTQLETLFIVLLPISLSAALFLPGQLLYAVIPVVIVGAAATTAHIGARNCIQRLIPNANDRRILFDVVLILWFVAASQACGLTQRLVDMVLSCALPVEFTLFICAFLVTTVTGLCLPSVAFVMPVAIVLFPGDSFIAYTVLLAGFSAQFVTPAHLCLVISADTFGSSIGKILYRMFPALAMSTIGITLAMFAFN